MPVISEMGDTVDELAIESDSGSEGGYGSSVHDSKWDCLQQMESAGYWLQDAMYAFSMFSESQQAGLKNHRTAKALLSRCENAVQALSWVA